MNDAAPDEMRAMGQRRVDRDPMSAEQIIRGMLTRMGVEDAQSFSAGDLIELANLVSENMELKHEVRELKRQIEEMREAELRWMNLALDRKVEIDRLKDEVKSLGSARLQKEEKEGRNARGAEQTVTTPERATAMETPALGSRTHALKTWPDFFQSVVTGKKRFEIRKNDRDFRVGDVLWLREYTEGVGLTGRSSWHTITYMTPAFQQPSYVVLGLSDGLPSVGESTSEGSVSVNPEKEKSNARGRTGA